MSYHFHTISSIQDEANLLKRIVDLETQVRAKREKRRVTDNAESEQYSRIFEPITKTMKKLHSAETITSSDKKGEMHNSSKTDLIDIDNAPINLLQPIDEYQQRALQQPLIPSNTKKR